MKEQNLKKGSLVKILPKRDRNDIGDPRHNIRIGTVISLQKMRQDGSLCIEVSYDVVGGSSIQSLYDRDELELIRE